MEVEPLYGLNKYVAPKCRCRQGAASDASAGDALIEGGLTTVIGGGDKNGEDIISEDENESGNGNQQQQPQPPKPQPELKPEEAPAQEAQAQQPTKPVQPAQFPFGGGTPRTSAGSANANVVPTPTIPARPTNTYTPVRACDGCAVNGICLPTGAEWFLDDNCTKCTCRNGSGMGDYRCSRAGCTAKPAVQPQVEEGGSDDTMEEPEVQQPATQPKPPAAQFPFSGGSPNDKPAQPQPQPEEAEEELEMLPEPQPTVVSKPANTNTGSGNGGGTTATPPTTATTNNTPNTNSQFGIDQTTPYGEGGRIVCQASGGVTNRGSIPTIANYEDCYAG